MDNSLKGILANMAKEENRNTINIPSKNIQFEVLELTFKQVQDMESAIEKMESMDGTVHSLSAVVTKVTSGDFVLEGTPLIGEKLMRPIVESLGVSAVKELADGMAGVNGVEKS